MDSWRGLTVPRSFYFCVYLLGVSFLAVGLDGHIGSPQPLRRARLTAGQPKQLLVIKVAGLPSS